MPRFIPYTRHLIDDDDIAAVVAAMKSDRVADGPRVEAFEAALARACGAGHAVAVSGGTAALHLCMLAAGIGRGDRVLTSVNTFVASANAAELTGAEAGFVDIDPDTATMAPADLPARWDERVRAVIPVHYAGHPCDLPAIARAAAARGAVVIDDATHAIGSGISAEGGRWSIGSTPWTTATAFSFHASKTITTGEGGAIVTDDEAFAARCRTLRSQGIVRDPEQFEPAQDRGEPWYYQMQAVGLNYRMSELTAALGISQLEKLDRFVARRDQIVDHYNAAFADLAAVVRPVRRPWAHPAWHLYVLQIDFDALATTRTEVMDHLEQQGIGTQVHFIPAVEHPYFRRRGHGGGDFPAARRFYDRALSLPLHPGMTDDDVVRVVDAVTTTLT